MTIKTYKTAVRASAILAAFALSGGAFADGISESFESAALGASASAANASLDGNGTVATATLPEATGMGYPISGAHAQALEIAGTVTYTEASTPSSTGSSMVDFMFKVEPTDELENPTGDDIRVALAVGTNNVGGTTAPIKLWCKTTNGGTTDWVDLAPAVTTGTWVRATLVLNYSANKCSVSLNGDPALNGDDKWFYFVNATGDDPYVKSITMVGSTLVDDLVVQHSASSTFTPAGANGSIPGGSAVTYDYINKYGVTVEEAQSSTPLNAKSGLSVADKFEAGLDPKSDTKFELQTMTTTKDTVTLTFPGMKDVANYSITVKDASNNTVTPDTGSTIEKTVATGENVNTATVKIPSAKQNELLYFTVTTTP